MNSINFYKRKNGFTLVELVVVIAILVVLAAIAVPNLGWFVKDANEADLVSQGKVVLINVEDEVAALRKEATDTGRNLEELVNQNKEAILKESDLVDKVNLDTFVIEIENRQLSYFEFVLNERYVCYNDGEVYINKNSQAGNR